MMMMMWMRYVLLVATIASTASSSESTDDLSLWLSNLNVSLPDITLSLLGKDIGTRNLTCSGFEIELESSVSESTRLDANLKSLGAKCEGGLLMGDKHGGVNLYIVDTSSVDVGIELEGTKSAKSTGCSSKLKLDASFSGDLELTLNLLWPLARGEVESLIGTKLCDTWKDLVETNLTAVMNQVDEMLTPHEKPSPDFPPPELPSGQDYVVWHELAVVEAADCFGAETLVKAIDAAASLLTGGTGEITISAKTLNQSVNVSVPNLVNLTAQLETLTIGGLDTLTEVTLYPVSGEGSYEQILGSFLRADSFKVGAGASVTVSPLNLTLSDSVLQKTLNLDLGISNGEIDTKTVIAISETFLRHLEPSQFLEPGCLVESVAMWNFTKLAFNATALYAQTSMLPRDSTSEDLTTFLNNAVQIFSNAFEHSIVVASSNVVDTQIRVTIDTIVMQAFKSLNASLTCEKPTTTTTFVPVRKDRDSSHVVGTLEDMLKDLRVVADNQNLALKGMCGGDYYKGTPELVVNLTDLSLSNLSLSEIESDLSQDESSEVLHIKASVGASVEISWGAKILDFEGNKTMTQGTTSLWIQGYADTNFKLSGDDAPTIMMSSCDLGLHSLHIFELKTKLFPDIDVDLLNGAAGILAQMIGAQIGPKICTNLTTLVSSKGNPIVQNVQQILQGLDSLPLPPNVPPSLPHHDDEYYVNWKEENLLNVILSKITDRELVTTINAATSHVLENAAFDLPLPESMMKTISLPLGQGGVGNLTINGLNAGGLDTFTKLHFGPNDEVNQSLVTSLGMSSARLGIDLALSLTLPNKIGNGTMTLSAPQLSNKAKAGIVVNDFEIDVDIFAAVSKQTLSNFSLGQYVELGCWIGATDSLNITSMMLNMTGTIEPVLLDTNPNSVLETALGEILSNTIGFVDRFFQVEIGLALRYLTDTLVRDKVNELVVNSFSPSEHNFTCKPQDPPQDLVTLVETPTGRSATIAQIVLIAGTSTLLIVLLALYANRFVIPHKDVDHALPMPDDATRTPLDVWGLPDKMQGVPRNMSLYMRVRKWLPLAMSFPLRDGWTGYFIRVIFPIVIGLCVALRVSSLILNVMNVDVQIFEEDTKQWEHRVVSFAFQTLLVDFWESKAEILAVFIFISSALVPISSILMMLCMWILPFNPKWRGRIFKFSDVQSKFTFVSEVFLVLVLVTFASIDVTIGTTRVRMRPQAGKAIVTGLVGTMLVKFASHFLMTMHNFRIGRGRPSMLLVRQFFGADAHESIDTRNRPSSLLRSTPSLIRQPLGDYSKYVRGTVMLTLLAVPTFFAGMMTSPLLVTHYEGLVGEVMGDFDVSQNTQVYLTDLVTKLVPNTDTKGIATFMAVSMGLIMIVIPILNWLVVCLLWLVPIENNRTLVHLAAFARILYGWNALDALFFALFVTKLELHLVGNWILNDRVPELCGAVSSNLGEECLELSVTYRNGFWFLIVTLVAIIPLMVLTFFYEDNLIRRRDASQYSDDDASSSGVVEDGENGSPSPGVDGDLRDPLLRNDSIVDEAGFDSASSK